MIMHDRDTSTLYLNNGDRTVTIERPKTRKYEWKRKRGERIGGGDYVEVTMKKINPPQKIGGKPNRKV